MPQFANNTAVTARPEIAEAMLAMDASTYTSGAIAIDLLRPVAVEASAGSFSLVSPDDILDVEDKPRAQNEPYGVVSTRFGTVPYSCVDRGLEQPVNDRQSNARFGHMINAYAAAGLIARGALVRGLESRTADMLTNTAVHSGRTTPVGTWSNPNNATPISDIADAIKAIRDRVGFEADTVAMSVNTFWKVRATQDIRSAVNSAGAGTSSAANAITRQILADALGVSRVLVSSTPKRGVTGGATTCWPDDYVVVGKFAMTDNLEEPSAARGLYVDSGFGLPVFADVEDVPKPDMPFDHVRVSSMIDEVQPIPDAMQLLSGVAA